MHSDYIYGLYTDAGDGTVCFYIGRSNDMDRRLREHNYSKRDGTELKYQTIRALEREGIKWWMDLIAVVESVDEHFEDWYVYEALLDGQPLTNQKAGDAKKAAAWDAMTRMQHSKARYSSAKEFLTVREREIAEEKARKDAARLAERVRAEQPKVLTGDVTPNEMLFCWEKPHEKFVSPWMKARKAKGYVFKGRN
jgi:hypothetical protein